VRKSIQEKLRPRVHGWHNVRCPGFVAQEEMVYLPDARRYEAGTANLAGLAGLTAAMELLLEVGVENIAAELLRKRALLTKGLAEKGLTVLYPNAEEANASGIVSFYRPGADMGDVHRKLMAMGVHTSLRVDRAGRKFVRVSPHFYNTDAELGRLLDAV
jgi:selenocysteine lyase/cysteine desulfurase